MAIYKYARYFEQSNHAAFDKVSEPGHATPHSGIFRCEGCGENVVSARGHALPPQNHHRHTVAQGRIRWRLIVASHQIRPQTTSSATIAVTY